MRIGYIAGAFGLTVAPTIAAQSFCKQDYYAGNDFFDGWTWETVDDPTHGRVNYVDQMTAINESLSYVDFHNNFIMRADDTRIVSPTARGRDSVRILSQNAYNDSIIVLDLYHMPEGCSTWPAFWTLSQVGPWPNGGEIDIIEGVNLNTQNLASLHTTPGCNMTEVRDQTGTTISTDCDASVNANQGCGTAFYESSSYGGGFNSNTGGWYVMKRTANDGINVWFWPRDDEDVPLDITDAPGRMTLDDDDWGDPDAAFPTTTCDYNSHFDAHQMVFDLTFCGDWAGSTFSSSGCGTGSCEDYVNNNPTAFSEAYWNISSLAVYTPC